MISIDEAEKILDEVASGLPEEIFEELNGGIILLPEAELDPQSRKNDDLYILGEYHSGGGLGRYISIYYGSFERLFGDMSRDKFKKELEITLKHELTHHLESLAGERDLEKEDDRFMEDYLTGRDWNVRRRRLRRR
ncbi:MAG TPA: metallopeptidase family protein [Anaerovoracaceae bacterium]|nr:metallopeptidase family protein [Anaerovoracaceae bacterium]